MCSHAYIHIIYTLIPVHLWLKVCWIQVSLFNEKIKCHSHQLISHYLKEINMIHTCIRSSDSNIDEGQFLSFGIPQEDTSILHSFLCVIENIWKAWLYLIPGHSKTRGHGPNAFYAHRNKYYPHQCFLYIPPKYRIRQANSIFAGT